MSDKITVDKELLMSIIYALGEATANTEYAINNGDEDMFEGDIELLQGLRETCIELVFARKKLH